MATDADELLAQYAQPELLGGGRARSVAPPLPEPDPGPVGMAQYGQGYQAPQLASGDGETLTTEGILARYNQQNEGAPGFLRRMADRFRGWSSPSTTTPVATLTGRERGLEAKVPHNVPLLAQVVGAHMPAGALDTAANWLDWQPRVGEDTIAPLGLAAMAPLTAVPGAAGIFGGRLARTANQEALARAERMAAEGADRQAIWDQTGWFQGRDGKWRFEIDDNATAFNRDAMAPKDYRIFDNHITALTGDAQGALPHAGLYAAYPELGPVSVVQGRSNGDFRGQFSGSFQDGRLPPSIALDFDNLPTSAAARSTLLHELQHGVQDLERFAPGANNRSAPRDIPNPEVARYDEAVRSNPLMQEYQRLHASPEYARELADTNARWATVYAPRLDALEAQRTTRADVDRLKPQIDALFEEARRDSAQRYPTMARTDEIFSLLRDQGIPTRRPREFLEPYEVYRRAVGEVESRNVQARADFTPEQRRARPPWETQDVSDADQILSRYGNGPQMSASEGNTIRAYHGASTPYEGDRYNAHRSQYRAFYAGLHPGTGDKFARLGGAAPRVYPVDIDTTGFFDFRNPDHVNRLIAHMDANPYFPSGSLAGPLSRRDWAREGDAGFYDHRDVQSWLRQNRFPGWFFRERTGRPSSVPESEWTDLAVGVTGRGRVRGEHTGDTLFADNARGSLPGVVAQGMEGGAYDVRPMSNRALHDIAQNHYTTPYTIDPVTYVPLSSLRGLYHDPARVGPLADQIRQNRWLEPMVVDRDGNVMEGQHRFRALEQLGENTAPVHRIRELGSPEQVAAIENAALDAKIHPQQARQISQQIMEIVDKEGIAALAEYAAPRGFEEAWNAAVRAAQTPLP